MINEWRQGEYLISTEIGRLDLGLSHNFLANTSYWAEGRDLELVRRSIANSLNFGLYTSKQQVGFARVVTDYATFAWLADVFVLGDYRGQGLGQMAGRSSGVASPTPGFSPVGSGHARRARTLSTLWFH